LFKHVEPPLIMRLIAMDMGEEFDLGKDETLKILEFLIDQN